MASDYKESSSNARILICLVLWVFPLIPALHPMLSTQETTFANASMHACDTRIHLLDQCDHIEGITETPQQSKFYKHDVYWNTSESHCDLTKYEMCQPEPTISPCQQKVDTTQVFTRSRLSDFFQLWMLMMCCMTIILDDVIRAIVPWITCPLSFEDREVPPPRCRTTVVGSPLFRVCQFAFLFGACILALGQGIPLWSMPKAFKAPGPRKRRQNNLEDNSFSLQGVFLKSTQPQQIVRTFSTIGDGNCFWRAVARNLPIKWYTLKRCVLRSALHDPNCNIDKSTIRHLMKKNQWADSTAIQLTATFLECNLAIWHKGGIGFFPTINRNASTIFLSLSRHHFESIPVKRGIELLATCDPLCPMPIQALPFCVGTEYSENTTIPCRTLKISRVGYFERFSFTPPHQFANPGNIGLGLLMRDNPQQCYETSQSKARPKHHSRKKDSRRTSRCQRHAWPIWYVVLMLLLRCLGTCHPTLRTSTFRDSIPLNLSSYTICSPNFLCSTLDTPNPKQFLTDPTSAWIHEDQPATQPSSRTVAVANAEAQHVLDTCYGCKQSYKQSWPDGYNCSQGCPHYLNSSLPIPVLSPFAPHYLHHNFWGGFANNIPQPHEAMVVTRAEILLEKQLRSLRSQMDSGEAANSREVTFPSCHNSGSGGAHLTTSNAISYSYDGTPLLRFRGLPKNPYRVRLSGGCIGAVQTPEGDRCKSPRNGSPQTPFGFLGYLVSTPFSSDESLCDPGFNCKQCYIAPMVKDGTGCRTAVAHPGHVDTVHLSDEHASQPCCMHYLTCMCSKDCTCNSYDYAVCLHRNGSFTLAAVHNDLNLLSCHPTTQFQGGYLCGSIAQTSPLRHSFACPPCSRARSPVMPVSPAELLLERQMIRLRTDLHHGPVQQDAQLIADMQRQYRDLQEDLEHRRSERSRSREPIRRKSQYELNRLMRGQAPAVAKPGAVVHGPVTPPKTPSPVRPVTPPKTPPSAPPLTLYSTSSSSVPRPPVPLTPKMPNYPPPRASGSSAPLVPKQPSYPPPPKVPGATQVVPKTIAKKAGKPKQPPKPPPAKVSSATAAVPETPSSSKAPAPDMRKAAAPCTGISNEGPPVTIKKIYIDTLGLRPDNAMAPEQSHPDVQLHIRVDLRKLHNPQQNYSLRSHTGLHKDTLLQIAQHREIPRVLALILQQCNAYDCIHVHIACTQGRHRSVGFSGILRQVLLSHMPQALVFVSHRAALNNWGPLCGMLRCSDCSAFRNLSPEGRALRERIANAVSSCFTLVVNSHPYVQLDPRYMFACSLCVSDLTCVYLRVQPVEDLQCQLPLHGGALEHHHDRDTANNYSAMQPCLLWFLDLLQPPPFTYCSKSFRPMTTCKEQICLRQHPLDARPTTRIETEAGAANHISAPTPNYPSSTCGFDFPGIVKLCNHLPQDGAHFKDALEHPRISATPAITGGCKLKTTLSCPNCLSPYFYDPFPGYCFPSHFSQPFPSLFGKDDAIQLQIPFFKKLRCLVDQYGFGHFNLKCLHKSNDPLHDGRHFQHTYPQEVQLNLDMPPKDNSSNNLQANGGSSPLLTFPFCHNSGRGDEDCNEYNAIHCDCGGTSPPRFKGLPKNPYGVHLSEGCIGAAHTSEGDHCKIPRNGLPQPPFGFLGSLFSRLIYFHNRSFNLGCDSTCCSDVEKTSTMIGSRTKNAHWCFVVTTCLKVEHGPQLCCTSPLTCICSKEYICNSHDHDPITLAAVHENLYCRLPHPWVQLQGGFLADNIVLPTVSLRVCEPARTSCLPPLLSSFWSGR